MIVINILMCVNTNMRDERPGGWDAVVCRMG
jgi:hypothetical protein